MSYLETLRLEAAESDGNIVERRICVRRAAKLRKRGESVVWDAANYTFVWFMDKRVHTIRVAGNYQLHSYQLASLKYLQEHKPVIDVIYYRP
jgi:hypothetical protein